MRSSDACVARPAGHSSVAWGLREPPRGRPAWAAVRCPHALQMATSSTVFIGLRGRCQQLLQLAWSPAAMASSAAAAGSCLPAAALAAAGLAAATASRATECDAAAAQAAATGVLPDELVTAAKRGRIDKIAAALKPEPPPPGQGSTATGKPTAVAAMHVDARAVGGRTLLSYAAERDVTLDLSRWMLEYGADPNATDQRGMSVMAVAAWKGCVQTLLLLLRHGATAVSYDAYGLAPLHKAAGFGHAGAVKALLQVGRVPPDLRTVAVTAPPSHEAQVRKRKKQNAQLFSRSFPFLHYVTSLRLPRQAEVEHKRKVYKSKALLSLVAALQP